MIDSVLGANPSKKKLSFRGEACHHGLHAQGQPFQKNFHFEGGRACHYGLQPWGQPFQKNVSFPGRVAHDGLKLLNDFGFSKEEVFQRPRPWEAKPGHKRQKLGGKEGWVAVRPALEQLYKEWYGAL